MGEKGDDRVLLGWLLGGGLLAGGVVGVLALAFPQQPAGLDQQAAMVNGAVAAAVGLATLLLRERLPAWVYRVVLVLGLGCVTASIPISGEPQNDTELLYVYLIFVAFYFFTWLEAFALLALTIASYGAFMFGQGGTAEGPRLLMFAAVLAASGIAFRMLGQRTAALMTALRRSARTDPLTGLLNRRGLQEEVERDLTGIGPAGAYSVIVADLDNFKQVNDKLGHMGGDMTLERVTALILRTKRTSDHAGRLGGEEFAVALPGAGRAQAEAIAERVRGAIERDFAGGPVPLTCSLGVAVFPEHGRTLEELLHSADRALYAAKDFGKNRALLYDEALKNAVLDLATGPGLDPS